MVCIGPIWMLFGKSNQNKVNQIKTNQNKVKQSKTAQNLAINKQ